MNLPYYYKGSNIVNSPTSNSHPPTAMVGGYIYIYNKQNTHVYVICINCIDTHKKVVVNMYMNNRDICSLTYYVVYSAYHLLRFTMFIIMKTITTYI